MFGGDFKIDRVEFFRGYTWRPTTLAFGANIGSGSTNHSVKSIGAAALTTGMKSAPESAPPTNKSATDTCKGNACAEGTDTIKLKEEEWISKYNLNLNTISIATQIEEVPESIMTAQARHCSWEINKLRRTVEPHHLLLVNNGCVIFENRILHRPYYLAKKNDSNPEIPELSKVSALPGYTSFRK